MLNKEIATFNIDYSGYDTNLQEAYRGCWIRRLQLLTLIIQDKTRTYKKQIEDAEEIAALNLAKFRKAQQQLEEARVLNFF